MNLTRMVIFSTLLAATSGCHFLRGKTGCHADQEYRHAVQMPALKVPAGLDAPNTTTALVIPEVAADVVVAPRGPRDACLEDPPKYKPSIPNKPQS